MPFGPCSSSFTETPCDGVVACNREHFDSNAAYLACLVAANLLISACGSACSDAQATDDAAALTAKDATETDCNTAYATAHGACLDTYNFTCTGVLDPTITASCEKVYNDCFAACPVFGDPGYAACVALCDGAKTTCYAGCLADDQGCEYSALLAQAVCLNDAEAIYAAALSADQVTAAGCARTCCSVHDSNPATCQADCSATWYGCTGAGAAAQYTCLAACLPQSAHCGAYGDDLSCTGFGDCQSACAAAAAVAAADCGVTLTACNRDCDLADRQAQKWCGWWESYCQGKCAKTYETAAQPCLDAHTIADYACTQADTDCLAACDVTYGPSAGDCTDACAFDLTCIDACLADYAACQGTCASDLTTCQGDNDDTQTTCLASPRATQFDCDIRCCTDAHGHDRSVKCYQECWHSSGCQDGFGDCEDTFKICLAGCPGYYGADYDLGPYVFGTCSPCLTFGRE